jgi:hypothetical protein
MNTKMDSSARNWILVILGILFLISLTCSAIYFILKNPARSSADQKAQAAPQLTPTLTPVLLPTQPPIYYPVATPLPVSSTGGQPAGSTWRFIKFNVKEVGLFENVDTPGLLLKALCQQPKVPPPVWGELYRLDEQGILTPINTNAGVQIFKVK